MNTRASSSRGRRPVGSFEQVLVEAAPAPPPAPARPLRRTRSRAAWWARPAPARASATARSSRSKRASSWRCRSSNCSSSRRRLSWKRSNVAAQPRVEALERLGHGAHHAERGHERAEAVRAAEDRPRAVARERHRVLALAAEAVDRHVPVLGRRDGEAGGGPRPARRGGAGRRRRRRRGGAEPARRRGCRAPRRGAALPAGLRTRPVLLEARRRVVRDRLLRVQRPRPRQQHVVRLGNLRVRHAAVDRTHRRARLVVVEADALGALLGHDVEDLARQRRVHRRRRAPATRPPPW